ncbi:beta-lactamase-like protein [Pilobolus umbonatus]|nr:beta-lactamase-like protein [Pilobolus umbonatus]
MSKSRLPHLPEFTQLSDKVWRVMGLNPGIFTLQGTNTYLVGSGPRKILIDCGERSWKYVALLADSLQRIHPDAYISDIIISHCHDDHWEGLPLILMSELNRGIQVHKYPLSPDSISQKNFDLFPENISFNELYDNQVFDIDEVTKLRVIHTPGHTGDHCSFYLENEGIMFTVDCILGHGLVLFDDLEEYMDSLYRIKNLNPAVLYPGHGQIVTNGMKKIDYYIGQRLKKEEEIVAILRNHSPEGITPRELLKMIHGNIDHLGEVFSRCLLLVIGLQLIKLHNDKKARLIDEQHFFKFNIDPYLSKYTIRSVDHKWIYEDRSKL